jgi:putative oxidoreductase
MRVLQDLEMFLGRLLFAFVFAYFAIDQLTHWSTATGALSARGITLPALTLVVGIILQFFGALSLFFGTRTRIGALALIVYVIASTLIYHDVGRLTEHGNEQEVVAVLQNVAWLAGLLYVLANGAGRWSGDACASRFKTSPEPKVKGPVPPDEVTTPRPKGA